jgi:hypothetical protein
MARGLNENNNTVLFLIVYILNPIHNLLPTITVIFWIVVLVYINLDCQQLHKHLSMQSLVNSNMHI